MLPAAVTDITPYDKTPLTTVEIWQCWGQLNRRQTPNKQYNIYRVINQHHYDVDDIINMHYDFGMESKIQRLHNVLDCLMDRSSMSCLEHTFEIRTKILQILPV